MFNFPSYYSTYVLDTLPLHDIRTYTVIGKDYELNFASAQENPKSIQFEINQEVLPNLKEGDFRNLNSGGTLWIKRIYPINNTYYVTFYLGSR